MPRELARALRSGAMPVSATDIAQLATALQVKPHDLSRALTDDEKAEWQFYRVSARQVTEVWRRVAEASTAHNMTQRQVSQLLEISESAVSRAMRGERKTPVLNWHQAAKIAGALNLEEGAEAFIPGGLSRENTYIR